VRGDTSDLVAGVELTAPATRALERDARETARAQPLSRPVTMASADFVPTVAHELRGPLSSVVAFAHLLADPTGGSLTEEQRTYVDVIDRNANRLLRLIEDLLLLSRLEAGTLPLRLAPVRVPGLVEAAMTESAQAARVAEVTLTCDLTDGPELVCDEARVQQVLGALLANALAFTPAGGRINVTARPVDSGWELVVSDTGVGIPAAEQSKLFSPFFRASNLAAAGRSATRGAGLGLMISRAIVELHGGRITVASTEDVGTTVTVSLPKGGSPA
jgi:signal transduction histidine kinase